MEIEGAVGGNQLGKLADLYSAKGEQYFGGARPEMVPFIPAGISSLLDVGCGAGAFASSVKESHSECEVWGIELDPIAAQRAADRLDRVLCGEFSAETTHLFEKKFDCIVFNDVLEHMITPIDALRFARTLLEPGGVVVASIPNILHFYQIGQILYQQDWQYRDEGILDSTHLRFFTRKSILRMFRDAGFDEVKVTGINPFSDYRFRVVNALLLGRITDWKYVQFAVQASEG